MNTTPDRIERLADRLHALSRNAMTKSKAEALVLTVEVLMGEDPEFCEDFARSIERRLGTPPPVLRLTHAESA